MVGAVTWWGKRRVADDRPRLGRRGVLALPGWVVLAPAPPTDEGLGLQGMVLGGTRVESVLGEVLSSLMKLREWQILWNAITDDQRV